MGEPKIPEAAHAAAKQAVADTFYSGATDLVPDDLIDAALAAAEPLMHEGLRAENARLREALEDIEKGIYSGWLARKRAAGALAPSDEEPRADYDCDAYRRSGACGCSTGVLGAAPCPHAAPAAPTDEGATRAAP